MSGRVLIVEDEPNIAESLSYLLTHSGFSVSVESDGDKAIDRLTAETPDVMILDVMLPNKSGFDILRDVRGGPMAEMPVLMLTAKGQERDRQTAEALGATRFMTKPFSNREVVACIKELAAG